MAPDWARFIPTHCKVTTFTGKGNVSDQAISKREHLQDFGPAGRRPFFLVELSLVEKKSGCQRTHRLVGRLPGWVPEWGLASPIAPGAYYQLCSAEAGYHVLREVMAGCLDDDPVTCVRRMGEVTVYASPSDYGFDVLRKEVVDELERLKRNFQSPALEELKAYVVAFPGVLAGRTDPSLVAYRKRLKAEEAEKAKQTA
ncbi:MAG TPA: hypothetical protein VMQ44_03860 [Candidatus Saccharimonadales bacterium]|nr:hypothetical protein [Candidatus Saccharimonadales bacterium]